ncbi:YopX family protein [Terribacillus saccharophilus]|uniref:YopX family protein n=1 Tax=Terribacillus saccharophilus TaxID=361277 RepID=UPI00159565D9|nr:YopX family protein [Terribacillus saccharophilus]
MRDVKFRAWDNVDFKMLYTGEEEDVHFYFDSNGIVAEKFHNTVVDTVEGDRIPDVGYEKLEHLQYMQYTSLKDKNGKEIYEGDVLKVEGSKRRYVVRWNNEESAFTVTYKYANDDPAEWVISEFREVLKTFEVIGNIYENPELLQE